MQLQTSSLLLAALLVTATPPYTQDSPGIAYTLTIDPAAPEWSHGLPLYQVFLHRYTPEGTINAFRTHLPRIKELGVGIIWLMPIHPQGELLAGNRNPFRIKDHFALDPGLGSESDLHALIADIHELGMFVILGVVPNHTAYDSPTVRDHPEYYVQNKDGTIASVGPWPYIADLDYDRPDTRAYGYRYLDYWLSAFAFDGFRCDVAARIPGEFWRVTIPRLRVDHPEAFFLAEADEDELVTSFDLLYDWRTAPTVWNVTHGVRPATSLDTLLLYQSSHPRSAAKNMRHMDNHDIHDQKSVHPFLKRVPSSAHVMDLDLYDKYGDALRVANVLYATLPGKYMLFNGQEVGYRGKLSHNLREAGHIDWRQDSVTAFYRDILALHRLPEIATGEFEKLITDHDDRVFAYRRGGPGGVIVVLNLQRTPVDVQLPALEVEAGYRDYFTHAPRSLDGPLVLERFGYRVFHR